MEPPGRHGDGRGGDWPADAILALACAVLAVATVTSQEASARYDFPDASGWLIALAVGSAVLLAVRRRWPLVVCLGVISTVFTIGALRWNAGSTPAFVLIALYTVAAGRRLRSAALGLGFAYLGAAVLIARRAPYFDNPAVVLFFLALTGAWSLGRWVRHRRGQREAALALALAAEREGALAAERAVLSERLHVARELHDVVSHTLTVIAVRSGVTRHRLAQRLDEDSRDLVALSAIETSSRVALDDLRRLLGVLRAEPGLDPAGPDTAPAPAVAPAPSRVLEDWVDATTAVTLATLAIGLAFVDDPSSDFRFPHPDVLLVSLILLATLPLAVRRRLPVVVFLVGVLATLLIGWFGWNPDWPGLATYVALYTVAASRKPLVSVGCWLVSLAGDVLLLTLPLPHTDTFVSVPGLQALVPLLLGLAVRHWRSQQEDALSRALETQRTQTVMAARAAFAERLRIAAEMHDVVAHTLSAIAVQSAVLRHRQGDATGPDADAVVAIDEASRGALEDLRRMLGVFRDDDANGIASLSPTPGLAELDLLISAHRAAHGPVEVTVTPGLLELPDSLQLTAFRLVQEALTNVRKHAAGATAHVQVGIEPAGVMVQVDDRGAVGRGADQGAVDPLAAESIRGFGLAGMRERVEMFGGSLDAGPSPEGGFRIQARLPLPAETPATA